MEAPPCHVRKKSARQGLVQTCPRPRQARHHPTRRLPQWGHRMGSYNTLSTRDRAIIRSLQQNELWWNPRSRSCTPNVYYIFIYVYKSYQISHAYHIPISATILYVSHAYHISISAVLSYQISHTYQIRISAITSHQISHVYQIS